MCPLTSARGAGRAGMASKATPSSLSADPRSRNPRPSRGWSSSPASSPKPAEPHRPLPPPPTAWSKPLRTRRVDPNDSAPPFFRNSRALLALVTAAPSNPSSRPRSPEPVSDWLPGLAAGVDSDWSVTLSNRRRAVGFKSRALGLRSLASFESLRRP